MSHDAKASYLVFFPYLQLNRAFNFGRWQIQPIDDYSGAWLGDEFERQARAFVKCFRTADGNAIDKVTVLSHRTRGIDGRLPTRPQRLAIQRAVDFAVLDHAPSSDSPNSGHFTSTSDNSALFAWPIDAVGGRVTLERGAMVHIMSGGHRIGNKLTIPAPLELHMPFGGGFDQDVLSSVYRLLTQRLTGDDDATRNRIGVHRRRQHHPPPHPLRQPQLPLPCRPAPDARSRSAGHPTDHGRVEAEVGQGLIASSDLGNFMSADVETRPLSGWSARSGSWIALRGVAVAPFANQRGKRDHFDQVNPSEIIDALADLCWAKP